MPLRPFGPRRALASDLLDLVATPVAAYHVTGRGGRVSLKPLVANAAASGVPPPDDALAYAAAEARAAGEPRDLGTAGAWTVRAVPLDGADAAVALVYSDAPPAVSAGEEAQAILDAIADVVLVYPLTPDGPGPLLAFNQAAVDTYGYSAATLRTLRVTDLTDPTRFDVSRAIEELMRRREGRFDSVHVTRDGRRIPMQTAARLFQFGGTLCVLAVCRDDADRRAFQREITRANGALERRVAERTAEVEGFATALQTLHRLTTTDHASAVERADAFLEAGCRMFGLSHGILSRIYPGDDGSMLYRVEAIRAPDGAIPVGATVPLVDVFCDTLLVAGATVSFPDAAADPRVDCSPAYTERGLRAFIGAPLRIGDRLVGSINFSSPEPRAAPFAAHEHSLIEIMADAMAQRMRADAAWAEPVPA